MMIVFEPHADDAVLFACYSLLAHATTGEVTVVTVLGSDTERTVETRDALQELGIADDHLAWPIHEKAPNWSEVKARMSVLFYDLSEEGEHVACLAPAPEEEGHDHHNNVGRIAQEVFGDACGFYMTYRRGHGRSKSDTEVEPLLNWRAMKYRALSRYPSQIEREDTRPWFIGDEVLREWVL